MLRRVNLTLFALIIIGLISFLFLYNRESVTIFYTPSKSATLPIALAIVVIFLLGSAFAGLIGLFINTSLSLRLSRRQKEMTQMEGYLRQVDEARSAVALGEFETAIELLSSIIERDEQNISARVELSKLLEDSGELSQALQVLDVARFSNHANPELLLRASMLNEKLGNLTASFDNSALLTQSSPRSVLPLQRSVHLLEQLNRTAEAIELQRDLLKITSGDEYQQELDNLARLKLKHTLRTKPTNLPELKQSLETLNSEHRDHPGILGALGEVECELGSVELATKYWSKSYKAHRQLEPLRAISGMLIQQNTPDRAVRAIRSLVSESQDLTGKVFLARLLAELESIDAAIAELEEIKQLLPKNLDKDRSMLDPLLSEVSLLESLVLFRRGEKEGAFNKVVSVSRRILDTSGTKLSVKAEPVNSNLKNVSFSSRLESWV